MFMDFHKILEREQLIRLWVAAEVWVLHTVLVADPINRTEANERVREVLVILQSLSSCTEILK